MLKLPGISISALALCFLLAIGLPMPVHLLGWASDTANLDNRNPEGWPKWPGWARLDNSYTRKITAYLNDRFGGRVEMVILNHQARLLIGVSGIPGLIAGRDGWQFLSTHNNITEQHRGVDRFSDRDLDRFVDSMEQFHEWLKLRGIRLMVTLAPNQQTIYPEYLPRYINIVNPETRYDQIVRRLAERHSSLPFIDLRPVLQSRKSMGLLYNRVENHWTALGGFLGLQALVGALQEQGAKIPSLSLEDYDLSIGRGDFPPAAYRVPAITLVRKATASPGRNQPITKPGKGVERALVTTRSDAPSLYVIGDSFAGVWDQFAPDAFSRMYYSTNIQGSYPVAVIDEIRPDIVIIEIVERYVNWPGFMDISGIPIEQTAPLSSIAAKDLVPNGGYVDGITVTEDLIRFHGWAMHPASKRAPAVISLYLGDKPVRSVRPGFDRGDIAAGLPDKLIGFNLPIRRDVIERANEPLRLVATYKDGSVGELIIDAPQRPKLAALGIRQP